MLAELACEWRRRTLGCPPLEPDVVEVPTHRVKIIEISIDIKENEWWNFHFYHTVHFYSF